jgi:hypothetical protein
VAERNENQRMKSQRSNVERGREWDGETTLTGQIAAAASLVAFLFYFRSGDLLLYGDAVAHINIARRVFDSRTPGLLQLGTVWLPLPHVLMIPFLLADSAWQTGVGGAIPSMVAYVLGTVGVFRLLRGWLSFGSQPDARARIAPWLGTIIYAANPNLLYMQTTAMTEALYLALFIWAVVHVSEFAQRVAKAEPAGKSNPGKSLVKCGWCLAGACLTRYDGWFLAGVVCIVAFAIWMKAPAGNPALRRGFAKFVLLAMAAPVLWVGYNAAVYRNPLEFANGPYSARAIEAKRMTYGVAAHPGEHDLRVAFSYFLKSAELNVADLSLEGAKWQKVWVTLLLAGTLLAITWRRRLWPLLLLWTPVPFYMYSIAYGGVPIYLRVWWPFSYYNVRYGLELLPAFAAFSAVAIFGLLSLVRSRWATIAIVLSVFTFLAFSYVPVWRERPACYLEAWFSGRRIAFESELGHDLKKFPHDATFLMYLGDHVGALQRAGIPLKRTINEGNHRTWERPTDPQGLWERALADPKQYADYVVAIGNDPVAVGVERRDLTSVAVILSTGQPQTTIYWTHRALGER